MFHIKVKNNNIIYQNFNFYCLPHHGDQKYHYFINKRGEKINRIF